MENLDPDSAHFERTLGELAETEASLNSAVNSDADVLADVQVALGSLYARRYLEARAADTDRAEGIRLLRAARAAGRVRGAVEPDQAMLLVALLMSKIVPLEGTRTPDGMKAAMSFGLQVANGGPLADELRETHTLLNEVLAARPGDPEVAQLASFANALGLLFAISASPQNASDDVLTRLGTAVRDISSAVPSDVADQMDALLSLGRQFAAFPEPEPSQSAEPPGTGQPDGDALIDKLLMLLEATAPGAVLEAELPRLIGRLEAAGADRRSRRPSPGGRSAGAAPLRGRLRARSLPAA